MQLCGSLSILWDCLSLVLEWKLTFSSPMAPAEFSKFLWPCPLLWTPLSGFANRAAPVQPRLLPGSSPASPSSSPSSWYRHSVGWYSVERRERRSDFLGWISYASIKAACLTSQCLGALGGMAFEELILFDFPSTPTHSAHPHKVQTQIKVWRHICVIQC